MKDSELQGFHDQLDSFVDQIDHALESSTKAAVVELYDDIVGGTPVDSGRAKQSWLIDEGSPQRSWEPEAKKGGERYDPSEIESHIASEVAGVTGKADDYSIYSNLVYMPRLEYEGHSMQAPDGWVRQAVLKMSAKFKSLFKAEVERGDKK